MGRQGQEYEDVGHVGIISGSYVVHASARMGWVVEEPLDIFLVNYQLVRVRRVIGL